MRLSLASFGLVAIGLVAACSKEIKPTGAGGASDLPPNMVVATVAGQKITAKELDESIGDELYRLEQQRYQIRRGAIEQQVVEKLVDAEAKKKGITKEAYLKAEVEDKVPPPADAEILQMFDQAKGQLPPDATIEQYRAQIVNFMTGRKRQELMRTITEELKKTAKVEITLPEPPRPKRDVEPKGPSRGPADAKVTIVEFSDFQCPFCSRGREIVEEVMAAYPGKARLFFRHYPLPGHTQAPKAAEASMCANEQGKFWEYHDVLFKNQQQLMPEDLKKHAATLSLDAAKFAECLDQGKHTKYVADDMEAGGKAGVTGTPAFFVNGIMLNGAVPVEEFKKVIDAELAKK
jgi:protein-disulfide isomerase